MIIFPAVDIQNGKAVRLKKGARAESTIFADNPLELAREWARLGAEWLHIVDLDGAFDGESRNMKTITAITATTGLPCQVGGGIRSLEKAEQYMAAGAARLIIGTMALENPVLFTRLCERFPGKIGVSLDARAGRLQSRGWERDANLDLYDAIPVLERAGAAFIIFTDIERDGMKSGINLKSLAGILGKTRLPVIAAGGVSSMADIRAIHSLAGKGNLEGAISGRALCDGSLDLAEAVAWLKNQA